MIRQASVALIRQDDTVLLVQQLGSHDSRPYWTLPGGTVENGETLPETLIREVREETGLRVTEIGGLVYLVQSITDTTQSIAFIFEVKRWTGIPSAERDTFVFETAFFPMQEAIALLDDGPYLNMREPKRPSFINLTPSPSP